MSSQSCVCDGNHEYDGRNCAHYLSNWLIETGQMDAYLNGCYCCASGRPLRAKELRENYFQRYFTMTRNEAFCNCFIYCERNGQGHVYYGTKNNCVEGTGTGALISATYYEYYQ